MGQEVCDAITKPDVLLGDARLHFTQLQQQAGTIQEDKMRTKRVLDVLVLERQKIITWARKGRITDEDREYQLTALNLLEMTLKREFATHSEIVD